jgi:hypothetical protein
MKVVKSFLKSFAASHGGSEESVNSFDRKRLKCGSKDDAALEVTELMETLKPSASILDVSEAEHEVLRAHLVPILAEVLQNALLLSKREASKVVAELSVEKSLEPGQVHGIFGCPLHQLDAQLRDPYTGLPKVIVETMSAFIDNGGFEREGPFRIEGDKLELAALATAIQDGFESEHGILRRNQAPVLAALIKRYLRQIPGFLIPTQALQVLLHLNQRLKDASTRLLITQILILCLPHYQAKALMALLTFLQASAHRESTHKMSAAAIAVCLGPSVFDCGLDLQRINSSNALLGELIANRHSIINLPLSLLRQ